MEVFLIPVGSDRYQLYCEVPDEDPSGTDPEHDRGFFRGLVQKFRETLNRIERDRHTERDDTHDSWFERQKNRALKAVAESIAEQRLLWHLRRQQHVKAVHPSDMDAKAALATVRASLQSDLEKHRKWLVIDGVLVALSGLLILVPGPNVVGYYFAFRVVGHYFSMRGATRGLNGVEWCTCGNDALAELRPLVPVDCNERRPRVEDIAARLQLAHLRRFFDRVAIGRA